MAAATADRSGTDRIIAGYYPSWAIYSARQYWVSYPPFDRITHVYYAFANVDPVTYEVVIGDTFADLTHTKDPETGNGLPAGNLPQLVHYRDVGHNGPPQSHLKVIISVGGWTWSGLTWPRARRAATSCRIAAEFRGHPRAGRRRHRLEFDRDTDTCYRGQRLPADPSITPCC
jgi:GH18 family chitinase